MKVILEPAFVVHAKPYRETSLLIDFFTKNHGKIGAIAKGLRNKTNRYKSQLQGFSPLLISFSGKNDLVQLIAVEQIGAAYVLVNNNLFNGLYLNELILKLLQRGDAHPKLFAYYQDAIYQLQEASDAQEILRIFERHLLAELGYGLPLNTDTCGKKISPEDFYDYRFGEGIIPVTQKKDDSFQGSVLLAIDEGNLQNKEVLKAAKRLMRLILKELLGSYQLKSRELFYT